MPTRPHTLSIALPAGGSVSGLLQLPANNVEACFVLAHGAGAGMAHSFMAAMAQGLAERGIATLRFNFPFMEQGSKRADSPAVAHAAVRAAVAEATRRLPDLRLFAGGKSFGGRMTTQAQATEALPGVAGIALLGFPLHAASKPSIERAAHLSGIKLPMLFLQGTRDALADLDLITQTTADLGKRATLHVVEGADHAFHVLVRSGRKNDEVLEELLDALAGWMKGH
jgi:predicted alpha/beta-hydrolase family hydrolase